MGQEQRNFLREQHHESLEQQRQFLADLMATLRPTHVPQGATVPRTMNGLGPLPTTGVANTNVPSTSQVKPMVGINQTSKRKRPVAFQWYLGAWRPLVPRPCNSLLVAKEKERKPSTVELQERGFERASRRRDFARVSRERFSSLRFEGVGPNSVGFFIVLLFASKLRKISL
ncbi:hypothetical protein NE237_029489 [Protea cynaroides]|uniref:Uncharacterized protein n=1 Tax=Protea cynaroides TaxID=273540 RepID=A0A9Q0GRA8_9MAGN|nr:hypothetical protein NE237_029489 [Protea cynaroides]